MVGRVQESECVTLVHSECVTLVHSEYSCAKAALLFSNSFGTLHLVLAANGSNTGT